jgi:hypothetical protein
VPEPAPLRIPTYGVCLHRRPERKSQQVGAIFNRLAQSYPGGSEQPAFIQQTPLLQALTGGFPFLVAPDAMGLQRFPGNSARADLGDLGLAAIESLGKQGHNMAITPELAQQSRGMPEYEMWFGRPLPVVIRGKDRMYSIVTVASVCSIE